MRRMDDKCFLQTARRQNLIQHCDFYLLWVRASKLPNQAALNQSHKKSPRSREWIEDMNIFISKRAIKILFQHGNSFVMSAQGVEHVPNGFEVDAFGQATELFIAILCNRQVFRFLLPRRKFPYTFTIGYLNKREIFVKNKTNLFKNTVVSLIANTVGASNNPNSAWTKVRLYWLPRRTLFVYALTTPINSPWTFNVTYHQQQWRLRCRGIEHWAGLNL